VTSVSTSGVVGFRLYDQDKGVYNQCDSYPSELGWKVMCFVRDIQSTTALKQAAIFLTPGDPVDEKCVDGGYELFEAISKHTPGSQITINENSGFLGNSLFCKWAYIINLDLDLLEVYKGPNNDPHATGRYSHLCDEDVVNNEYRGVALVLEVQFDKIKLMTRDQIYELCNILEQDGEAELFLHKIPKYSIANPPTIKDRIRLLELE
jgi:hypothetical protein